METIWWTDGCPVVLDQTLLPAEETALRIETFQGAVCAPDGADAYNPAFDVTPARLIAGIVTENGVCTRDKSFAYRI